MATDSDIKKLRQMSIAALTRVAREGGTKISKNAKAREAFLDSFKTRHKCDLCGVIEIDQSPCPRPSEIRRVGRRAPRSLHPAGAALGACARRRAPRA